MAKFDVMALFAQNVRRCLDSQGITITALAERSGIYRANLSRILHGKEGISLDRAQVIADSLGVGLHELLSPNFKILSKSA